jgi:hypothetical protein
LWPLAQSWTNASQVAVYDTLFTCYMMTMVLSRTRKDVAALVEVMMQMVVVVVVVVVVMVVVVEEAIMVAEFFYAKS